MSAIKDEKNYAIKILPTAVLSLSGLVTLMPVNSASSSNLFGYLSLCPNAPISTIVCFLGAWFFYMTRVKR